jgi:hypothetical protein
MIRNIAFKFNWHLRVFLNFDLDYLRRDQSFEPLHTKMPLIILLVGITGCMATNRNLFRRTVLYKCGRVNKLFMGLRLVSKEFHHSAIQTKIEENFGGFFHQRKVRQSIGRKDSKQTLIPTSRRLHSFLYEAAQNFDLFSNIQDQNKKIKNI